MVRIVICVYFVSVSSLNIDTMTLLVELFLYAFIELHKSTKLSAVDVIAQYAHYCLLCVNGNMQSLRAVMCILLFSMKSTVHVVVQYAQYCVSCCSVCTVLLILVCTVLSITV